MLLLMLMLKASQAVFWSVAGWQFPVLSVLTLHRADRTDKLHANPILAGMLELGLTRNASNWSQSTFVTKKSVLGTENQL